jgi:hypothetical protein
MKIVPKKIIITKPGIPAKKPKTRYETALEDSSTVRVIKEMFKLTKDSVITEDIYNEYLKAIGVIK